MASALLFACAYSDQQIGRNAFVVAVTPRGLFNQNFRQILAWSVLSAPLWVAGGIADGEALRWVLWLGALGLDLVGPLVTYRLPRVGPTPMSQANVDVPGSAAAPEPALPLGALTALGALALALVAATGRRSRFAGPSPGDAPWPSADRSPGRAGSGGRGFTRTGAGRSHSRREGSLLHAAERAFNGRSLRCSLRVNAALSPTLGRLLLWTESGGRGIAAPGSHRSRRDSLPSPGSSDQP